MTDKVNDVDVKEDLTTETDAVSAEEPIQTQPETEAAISTPDTATEEPSAELTIEALQAALETAQAEAAKNLAGWQRAAADLANYKRRQEEQNQRLRVDLTSRLIGEILPALDDFDLAFQNLPESLNGQEKSWADGFHLVQRKLLKVLETYNVQEIDTGGEFDPNLHEAVTHEESDAHESNTIIGELRKGYTINDRVLRPALVRVAQ